MKIERMTEIETSDIEIGDRIHGDMPGDHAKGRAVFDGSVS